MKCCHSFLCAAVTAVCAFAVHAETWYWYGGTKHSSQPTWGGDVNKAANWTNETHTLSSGGGIPARGDSIVFDGGVNKMTSNNGTSTNPWGDILVTSNSKDFMQVFFCQVTGSKLTAEKNVFGTSGYYLYGDGEGEIVSPNSKNLTFQKPFLAKQGKPTLVKNGTWKLTCYYQGGSRDYTIPYTRIKQGTINITSTKENTGLIFYFDGDDATQCFEYTTDGHADDLKLKDSAFIETNGVANSGHSISAPYGAQLVLSGTPPVNPMVFSGVFKTKSGLTWSPANADATFVCSNGVSTATGRLVVNNGTVRLVSGASFTDLSEVKITPGGTLEVADVPSAAFKAAALTLESASARIKVGAGVTLTFTAGAIDGMAMSPGTYAQEPGSEERSAPWLEGAGKVCIETGPGNVGMWSGEGPSAYVTDSANWLGNVTPDLDAGDLLANFTPGGNGPKIGSSTTAKFAGLVLDNNLGKSSFSFTADPGGAAEIGQSGITGGKSYVPMTWSLGWPLTLTADQVWTVGANETLSVSGGLKGSAALTFANDGMVVFDSVSTHSGTLNLVKGKYRVAATDGLGSARTLEFPHLDVNLAFAGKISIANAFSGTSFVNSDSAQANAFEFETGADVTFKKELKVSSNGTLRFGDGARATFEGGLKATISAVYGSYYICGQRGEIVMTNSPMWIARQLYVSATKGITLDLWSANNRVSGDLWSEFRNGSKIRAHVTKAFDPMSRLVLYDSSTVELCGGSHELRAVASGSATTEIKALEPATLTVSPVEMNDDSNFGGTNRVVKTVFGGALSLVKGGTQPLTLGSESSSTGSIAVNSGELRMTETGAWPNCESVTISGGSLKLSNAQAFATNAVWSVAAAATVNLVVEGTNACDKLYLAGTRQSYGVYGAIGSGATHEVEWITGSGCLKVAEHGMHVILR